MPSISYHTRLDSDHRVKVTGGSRQGTYDQETVECLASEFTAVVKPSGRVVFVDSEGREVSLYIRIAPEDTKVGKVTLATHREQQRLKEVEQIAKTRRLQSLLDSADEDTLIELLERHLGSKS